MELFERPLSWSWYPDVVTQDTTYVEFRVMENPEVIILFAEVGEKKTLWDRIISDPPQIQEETTDEEKSFLSSVPSYEWGLYKKRAVGIIARAKKEKKRSPTFDFGDNEYN